MIKRVQDNEWGTVFKNFRKDEFKCRHGVGNGIYYSLLEVMQNLRNKYGSITISSGYRCPSCNASVGGDPNSAHLKGGACDFRIDSGWQDNLQNRMKLVTELRNTYNVHYAYCKVDENRIWNGYDYVWVHCNMGTYIHCDTNEGYYPIPIKKFNLDEIGEDYVKVSFEPSDNVKDAYDWATYSLNCADFVNLPTSSVINGLEPNTTYKIKIKLRVKGTPLWVESEELEFTTKEPHIEPKGEDSPITLPDTETSQNKPQDEELEKIVSVYQPINEAKEKIVEKKKSILTIILEFIVELIKKLTRREK